MTLSPSIHPRSVQPSGNELPLALRSVPAPKITLNPARSLLPDLAELSLAPATGPRRARGRGLFAGLTASVAAAVVDGLMSAGGLTPGNALAVVVHCVGVRPSGPLFGLLLEALLAAGARVVVAIRAWRWIASGPRVWFAPSPGLATRIFLTLFGVCAVVVPVFSVSRAASIHMRSPVLIGVTCAATCVAALALVPFAFMLLARWCAPSSETLQGAQPARGPSAPRRRRVGPDRGARRLGRGRANEPPGRRARVPRGGARGRRGARAPCSHCAGAAAPRSPSATSPPWWPSSARASARRRRR